jgi:hypothetical protein
MRQKSDSTAGMPEKLVRDIRRAITINTSPIDFAPIKQVQLRRFKGEIWELFGPVLSTEIGG